MASHDPTNLLKSGECASLSQAGADSRRKTPPRQSNSRVCVRFRIWPSGQSGNSLSCLHLACLHEDSRRRRRRARTCARLEACRARRAVSAVVCAPGNPGIATVARCIPADVVESAATCWRSPRREGVDLTVVGPEAAAQPRACRSLRLARAAHRRTDPRRRRRSNGARSSRRTSWRGTACRPRASQICESAGEALDAVTARRARIPARPQGRRPRRGQGRDHRRRPRSGRGGDPRHDGRAALRRRRRSVVLEEFLVGQEASYFVLADGARFVPFSSAQDHKRIFDDDRGPNTGGMGAFSPSPLLTPAIERRVLDEIVRPVLDGMEHEGLPYRGFLYVGLMLTADGPESRSSSTSGSAIPRRRSSCRCSTRSSPRCCTPRRPGALADRPATLPARAARRRRPRGRGLSRRRRRPGSRFVGLDEAAAVPGRARLSRRHRGTMAVGIVTAGGRVLTVVGRGPTYREAIDVAYRAASRDSRSTGCRCAATSAGRR